MCNKCLDVGKGRNTEFVFGKATMGITATRRGREEGAECLVIGYNPGILHWNGSDVVRMDSGQGNG